MSNDKVKTKLNGYKNQVFPEDIDMLNMAYSDYVFTNRSVSNMGSRIRGYFFDNEPTTNDGYKWFVGVHFKTRKGQMAVLFPYMKDKTKKDGTKLDRSISFYTDGKVDVDKICSEFYNAVMK